MPYTTRTVLRRAAWILTTRGLHTGHQFAAARHGALDVSAAIYLAAEGFPLPTEFYTDEVASIRIIECSAPAMQAIRALSAALDTEPCTTPVTDDHEVPDYIEHVSNWAATAAPFTDRPPTESEVIGRILRAAQNQDALARFPRQRTAA